LVWVRSAVFSRSKVRRGFIARVIAEQFGVVVQAAFKKLVIYDLAKPGMTVDHMGRLLGFSSFANRDKDKIQIDPESPAYIATERAINSYDPDKGWKFNTWLRLNLDWEYAKEVGSIIEDVKLQRKHTSGDQRGDIFETIDLTHAAPGHEEIIGAGAHHETAEQGLINQQELLAD
jgi:hypothetical protein